uniref:Uncharacterized protein n=1 Tax=Zea mays TaxID=4577 RepID=A0A804MUE0_MAIZE
MRKADGEMGSFLHRVQSKAVGGWAVAAASVSSQHQAPAVELFSSSSDLHLHAHGGEEELTLTADSGVHSGGWYTVLPRVRSPPPRHRNLVPVRCVRLPRPFHTPTAPLPSPPCSMPPPPPSPPTSRPHHRKSRRAPRILALPPPQNLPYLPPREDPIHYRRVAVLTSAVPLLFHPLCLLTADRPQDFIPPSVSGLAWIEMGVCVSKVACCCCYRRREPHNGVTNDRTDAGV